MLYGITDIGSNTVRLNVYRLDDDETSLMFSRKENLGLVFYIKRRKLTDEGIEKLVTVLKQIKHDLDYLEVTDHRFFATAALRNIENRAEVLEIIEGKVNIEIDVLSGEEEGELSFCGSMRSLRKNDGILIDLGGGSVEIVLFEDKKIRERYTIPAGSLKMYNEYVSDILPSQKECQQIKERVYSELKKIRVKEEKISFICGVGGSIRALGKLMVHLKLKKKKTDLIDVELLRHLEQELNQDPFHQLLQVKPSRVHTLIPALLTVESITSYFACEEMQISKFSVREGYLYKKVLNRCPHV